MLNMSQHNVPVAKKVSCISVVSKSRDVIFSSVHHLRHCIWSSGYHFELLSTRFTGGRSVEVAGTEDAGAGAEEDGLVKP